MQTEYVLRDIASSHVSAPVRETTDESLIGLIADGDKRAMQVLYARHNVRVFRFIVRLTGNQSLAEDLVSEVFLDVWRQANKFEGRSAVSTLLMTMQEARRRLQIRIQWKRETQGQGATGHRKHVKAGHLPGRSRCQRPPEKRSFHQQSAGLNCSSFRVTGNSEVGLADATRFRPLTDDAYNASRRARQNKAPP